MGLIQPTGFSQHVNKDSSSERRCYVRSEQTDPLYANAKDLIHSGKVQIRVASSSLVSFHHFSVCLAADLYPISIYITFLRKHLSYRFLSSLCSLEFSFLGVFGGHIYIFRNGDEGTWKKHLE